MALGWATQARIGRRRTKERRPGAKGSPVESRGVLGSRTWNLKKHINLEWHSTDFIGQSRRFSFVHWASENQVADGKEVPCDLFDELRVTCPGCVDEHNFIQQFTFYWLQTNCDMALFDYAEKR